MRRIAEGIARRVRTHDQIETEHLADRSEIAEREVHETTLEAPKARVVDGCCSSDIAQAQATPDARKADVGCDVVQVFSRAATASIRRAFPGSHVADHGGHGCTGDKRREVLRHQPQRASEGHPQSS
jgi:hypothetical protein